MILFNNGPDNIFAATMWLVAVDTGIIPKRLFLKILRNYSIHWELIYYVLEGMLYLIYIISFNFFNKGSQACHRSLYSARTQ